MYGLLLAFLTTCPATLAERQDFTVCFDTANRRALWTSHQPRPSTEPAPRKHWRKDRALNSLPSAAFTNTGYDRGHLVLAADLPESPDTFLTSNAIPQDPALNRGAWRRLEKNIREQIPAKVLTGTVYNGCGNDKIEAPCYVYKIVVLSNGRILVYFAENAPPKSQKPGREGIRRPGS